MKFLSDHNVNIEMRPFLSVGILLWAQIMIRSKSYCYMDIIEEGRVQQYLRSVIFNFKRIYELNS